MPPELLDFFTEEDFENDPDQEVPYDKHTELRKRKQHLRIMAKKYDKWNREQTEARKKLSQELDSFNKLPFNKDE